MKNIVIAIDDVDKFCEIKKCFDDTKYNVFKRDLIYEDAIFELIENDTYKIDILLVKYSIIKDKKRFKRLLFKYSNITCYVFVNENDVVENIRKEDFKNIYEYNNLDAYFVNKEILKIKELSEKDTVDKLKDLKDEFRKLNKNNYLKKFDVEIIVVTGEPKVGKSTYICMMLEKISINRKILYISFNYKYDYSISEQLNFNLKKYENVTCKFNIGKEINKNKIYDFYKKYYRVYDVIIFDMNYYIDFKYLKYIFMISNKIYFIIEPILSEINKTLYMMDYFIKNKLINDNEKIFIIFNKYDYKSICIDILKEIFKKYKIKCVIRRKTKYRRLLNKDIDYEYRVRR